MLLKVAAAGLHVQEQLQPAVHLVHQAHVSLKVAAAGSLLAVLVKLLIVMIFALPSGVVTLMLIVAVLGMWLQIPAWEQYLVLGGANLPAPVVTYVLQIMYVQGHPQLAVHSTPSLHVKHSLAVAGLHVQEPPQSVVHSAHQAHVQPKAAAAGHIIHQDNFGLKIFYHQVQS